MNQLIDLYGLFNSLRPDAPLGYGTLDEPEPETFECSVCPKEATREVRFLTPATGKIATIQVCDECYFEDALWENREIIQTKQL